MWCLTVTTSVRAAAFTNSWKGKERKSDLSAMKKSTERASNKLSSAPVDWLGSRDERRWGDSLG